MLQSLHIFRTREMIIYKPFFRNEEGIIPCRMDEEPPIGTELFVNETRSAYKYLPGQSVASMVYEVTWKGSEDGIREGSPENEKRYIVLLTKTPS